MASVWADRKVVERVERSALELVDETVEMMAARPGGWKAGSMAGSWAVTMGVSEELTMAAMSVARTVEWMVRCVAVQ